MSRNKSTKRTNKRKAVSNVLVSVQKMEMDLMQTPSKLAAQLDKEINAHKKQENKLIKALNKVNAQVKTAENRIQSAGKAKNASAGKKQLKVAKKIYKELAELHSNLNKQLQAVTKTLHALLEKQSKYTALSKYLSQFNKEWSKSSKNAKSKPQAKKIKSKIKNKPELTAVEHQHIQPVENTMENSTFDGMTEVA